ncbi:hypothetical protein HN51_010605, partial [Arachis hypogaea]
MVNKSDRPICAPWPRVEHARTQGVDPFSHWSKTPAFYPVPHFVPLSLSGPSISFKIHFLSSIEASAGKKFKEEELNNTKETKNKRCESSR